MALRNVRDDTLVGTFGDPTDIVSKKLNLLTASLPPCSGYSPLDLGHLGDSARYSSERDEVIISSLGQFPVYGPVTHGALLRAP